MPRIVLTKQEEDGAYVPQEVEPESSAEAAGLTSVASRQASEIIIEEEHAQVMTQYRAHRNDDSDEECCEAQEETASLGADASDCEWQPEVHVRQMVCHNPYNVLNPVAEIYHCDCSKCRFCVPPAPCDPQTPKQDECEAAGAPLFLREGQESAWCGGLSTAFMPPPPPPRASIQAFRESGAENAEQVFFHMMMRWYKKLVGVQHYFTDELCPPPCDEQHGPAVYSFTQWCGVAAGWWKYHFEHRQMRKPKRQVFAPRASSAGCEPTFQHHANSNTLRMMPPTPPQRPVAMQEDMYGF